MNYIDLSKSEEAILQNESLREKIEFVIEKLPPGEVTLTEIMDIVGADSLLLLTVFLSMVFLVPVSIPGVSTVFSIGILFIGITRLFSRKLWFPKIIVNRKLSSAKLGEGFARSLIWFRRLEMLSRPHRLSGLTSEGLMPVLSNLSFILAALLLMAPFGFIPFSNTLPALALIFLSVGMIQRDGVFILLGKLSNVATIVYFGFLIGGGGWSIAELFKMLR